MAEFLWALRFLTIIPIGRRGGGDIQPQRMGVVMSLFPVAGLVIGLCLVLVYIPLAALFPDELADALIIGTFILITGALHLDGLADYMDGILGGWDAKSRLEIMKDSRIGTFGVLGLLAVVGLKYLSFNAIGAHVPAGNDFLGANLLNNGLFAEKAPILLVMPVVGRWSQTLAAGVSPYARQEPGTAWALVSNTHPRHSMIASILPILLAGLLFGNKGIVITAVLAALVLIKASYINSRIGGMTGDTLGAINEESELVFLLLFYII
ncbi:MAG: adenosylcobinamide-GDP ribazoletransferase [Candidatus Brocadiales bacterium]